MDWSKEKVHSIVEKQRAFFRTGQTLPLQFRKEQLKKLKQAIINNQKVMEEALYQDLGRAAAEAYMCDIGAVLSELNETLHCLRRWAKPEHHFSGIACFPSLFTHVYKMPYGVSLIISPFNFPFLLSLGVLVAAISAGNTAVVKTSSKSKNCTAMMQKMIAETFPEDYVTVIDGGHDVADWCLEERFDKIFYTGSPRVGVHVMECAAKNLTPVALELGGENGNWCIIRKDADIKDAARKIAFFKICNSGQICININQVAVASEIADKFVDELKKAMIAQIGEDPINNPEYAKLIAKGAYDYCANEAEEYRSRIVFGGKGNPETLKYSPTIIYPVEINEKIVQHELFSPLLPIVKFDDNKVDDLLNTIASREHGLALYLFTKNKKWAKKVMSTQQYGGGCVNEVCIHLLVKGVPFNGTGHSGMGAYHGEWGFREFSHPSTVLFGSNKFNLSAREHPYNEKKEKFLKKFIK
ncbi:MAG: aldehyde dehydrogenase family protein [Bacilli bacterium]|nr:aldehyde dehydrogenase family protein [Bacilli bacterium]